MRLLIDGYNLLHASEVFPPETDAPTLERARVALLDALVDALPPKLVPQALVVFDAVHAPPGLPHELAHRGLAVRFSRRGTSADELLEDLIDLEREPKGLTVVSSDHRVQRAARHRGAAYADSGPWWKELRAKRPTSDYDAGPDELPGIEGNPFPPGYADDLLP